MIKFYPLLTLGLFVVSGSVFAASGVPILEPTKSRYSLVEVDANATAYNQAVQRNDNVQVALKWNKWSGENASYVEYWINDERYKRESLPSLSSNSEQSGAITIPLSAAGKYQIKVGLCSANVCRFSEIREVLVVDTDGDYMTPLTLNASDNNRSYVNSSDKMIASYFVEWGVYGRKFSVDNIPANNLTHILYGFIPVCGPNQSLLDANPAGHQALQASCSGRPDYTVTVHDLFAALGKKQAGQDFNDPVKGNFGQLMALKKAYPNIKVLPSVGGWTLTDPFYALDDSSNRQVFVDSLREFLQTWKFFDGVDIDWEYPGGSGANPLLGNPDTDGDTYLLLMQDLRKMMDELSLVTGREYQLTSAVGAGLTKIDKVDYAAVTSVVDYIMLMTYDFSGAWTLDELGHMAGVYPPGFHADKPNVQSLNVKSALDAFVEQGADMSKVAVGVAMYGRGWKGVTGFGPGQSPFEGSASGAINGSWAPGILDYKDIALLEDKPGWTKYYDAQAEAPFLFKPATGELISYDDAESIQAKATLVEELGLAGLFSWEIDADNGDILNAMHEGMGHLAEGNQNQPPVSKAGLDISSGELSNIVQLDGSGSYDPDGDDLQFSWSQLSGPSVTLEQIDQPKAQFLAAQVETQTTLTFRLTVSDNELSDSDEIVVTLLPKTSNSCSTADPAAANYQPWNAGEIYTAGMKVNHNALVWEARWWNRDSAPNRASSSAWQLLSNVELPWDAQVAYKQASEVNHINRRFKSAYWNKGSDPGVASVWQDIGVSSCR